jgi:AcrR family transcriptional regulator
MRRKGYEKLSCLATFPLLGRPNASHSRVVLYGTSIVKERVMPTPSTSKIRQKGGDETALRKRILEAAFAAFMKSGYASTSTLEIATHARVSKRELYAIVGNKQEMLIACISERAKRTGRACRPAQAPRSRYPKAGPGFFRDEACPRGKRSHGNCGISTGDRRGGPGTRSGACARLYRARDKPRRPA